MSDATADPFAAYKAKRKPPRRGLLTYLLILLLAGADAGAVWWNYPQVARALPQRMNPPSADIRGNFPPGVLTVVMLNVGQGDASYIHTPNGRNILFDAGAGGERFPIHEGYHHFNAGKEVTAAFLRENGVQWVDTVVVSHPDGDHTGGLLDVWEYLYNEGRGAGHYIDDGLPATSPAYVDQLKFITDRNLGYTPIEEPPDLVVKRELPWEFVGDPAIAMQILGPLKNLYGLEKGNENSIVIRIQAGPFSFLMAGDAENEEEESLVRKYGHHLRSDILWGPHHGSKTSILPAFVELANPRMICVSSFPPMYGHPNILAVQNWQRYVTPKPMLLRTNMQGTMWFRVTDREIRLRSVKPMKTEAEQWEPGVLARTAPEGAAAVFRRYGRNEPERPSRWETLPERNEQVFTPADFAAPPVEGSPAPAQE